jgi:hypothetical protein
MRKENLRKEKYEKGTFEERKIGERRNIRKEKYKKGKI